MAQTFALLGKKFQNVSDGPRNRQIFARKKQKLDKVPEVIGDLYKKAQRISAKLSPIRNSSQNQLLVSTLRVLLLCQMRFLAGIYISIFLEKDYKNRYLDNRVSNYFKGISNSYNELLGLSEDICQFLKKEKMDDIYDGRIFKVQFDDMRLKTPPISDNDGSVASVHYIEYGDHVMKVMTAVRKKTAFLENSHISINWNFRFYDNLVGFQKAAETLIQKDKVKKSLAKGLKQESGSCFLHLERGKAIQLDPIIVPMYKMFKGTRMASLGKFSGYMSDTERPIVYHELTGDGREFNTSNIKLLKRLYHKKGMVSEDPSFSNHFNMSEQGIKIKLYKGDIFDLNFLEEIKKKNNTHSRVSAAMVNLLYADLNYKTPLFQSLENFADCSFVEKLQVKNNDHNLLQKDRVYATGSGNLNFDWIIHCPIYDISNHRIQDIDIIKVAINNILDQCISRKIKLLVVPAMGSCYAGDLRQRVVETWCDLIQNTPKLRNSPLEQIIFSFINEETCDVYRNCISENNRDHFADCHLPVSRMYNYLVTAGSNSEKFGCAMNLSYYLYSFIVAWAIRALVWHKVHGDKDQDNFTPNPKTREFVKELRKRAGMDLSDADGLEHQKKMNVGHWRVLADLGLAAISGSIWDLAKWYSKETDKKQLKILRAFLNQGGGEIDFPKYRNDSSHPIWENMSASEMATYAESAEELIGEVIESMPFLKQSRNRMVKIEDFSGNEDEGQCTLSYRDLSGNYTAPPKKPKNFPLEQLGGRFFETGRVYLEDRDPAPDGSIKVLNMHPFLLYGECPDCEKDKLFIWRGFGAKAKGKVQIKYGSTTCGCKNINSEAIAGFHHNELDERFTNILNMLNPLTDE